MYSHAYESSQGRCRRSQRIRRWRGPAPAAGSSGRADRHADRGRERRRDPRCAPAAPGAAGRPGPGRHDRRDALGPRRGVPRAAARAVRRVRRGARGRRRHHRLRCRLPAHRLSRVGEVLRNAPRRVLALRAPRASRPADGAQRCPEGGRPGLLPDGVDAGARTGRGRRPGGSRGHRDRRRVRHQRSRQGRKAAPARQRGDGLDEPRTASGASTGTVRRSSRTSVR
ncbi:hypothetical protein ABIE44_003671 [Marmoricola sp. OAE513]